MTEQQKTDSYTTPGGITVRHSSLSLRFPDEAKALFLKTVSLSALEQAFEHYQVAMAIAVETKDPILNLWVDNPEFRTNIEECLSHFKVPEDKITALSLEQLSELVLSAPDENEQPAQGLLWRISFAYPKVRALPTPTVQPI